jgi:hypothetical protein
MLDAHTKVSRRMREEDCFAVIASFFETCLNFERILKLKLVTLHIVKNCHHLYPL